MADIELIVKIPEEKIVIEYGKVISIGRNNDKELADYIFAGTPLTESDDCVSREAILNELSKWDWQDLYLPIHFKELIIDELPSVQPNREKHDEEVIKETVASIWGKPPYTEVLDKIRAEIEQMPSELTTDGRRMIRRRSVFRIIDKYRKGQTDADSD